MCSSLFWYTLMIYWCLLPKVVSEIVSSLQSLYELRVSEGVELFLGAQIAWKKTANDLYTSVKLSQPLYCESILRRFGLQNCKPACTPMVEGFFSGYAAEEDKTVVNPELYQQMIGSLLYLALRTRFDILAAVLILARFRKDPTAYCHRATKRVLRYLKGTTTHGFAYTKEKLEEICHVDADYAGDTDDRKSMSGYLVKLGDAVCVWGAQKQSAVALSTCESEYYALTLVANEAVWISRVLQEAGIYDEDMSAVPVQVFSDNQSAIKWAIGERPPSGRAKHIEVRMHYIRDLVASGKVSVNYVASEDNDADCLTKPLGPTLMNNILKRVNFGGATEEEC